MSKINNRKELLAPSFAKSIIMSHFGVQRQNKYRIILPSNNGSDSEALDILCRSINFPSRTIDIIKRKPNMKLINVPTGYTNSAVNVTFTETNDAFITNYFDSWLGKIVSVDSYDIAYKSDIVRDIILIRLDEFANPVYAIRLINAYPKTKNSVIMSDSTNNTVVEIKIDFEYDDYEIIAEEDTPVQNNKSKKIKQQYIEVKQNKKLIPKNEIINRINKAKNEINNLSKIKDKINKINKTKEEIIEKIILNV